ncbi:MAG: polysaccharide biosynthesis/export family protein [Planctomycetota bacterium]|nr:polysaccharide biosynthesis/export family protein [Planctomycetota bacterium]
MITKFWTAFGLWAALVATACAPSAPSTGYEHLNLEIRDRLKSVGLGPGDVVEVRVYDEPSLTGVHRLADDGSVDFPLVGRMDAAGKTPRQVGELLTERLRDGYLVSPSVSVYVKQYNSRKIFVLGQVKNPGTFPYASGMNVVEAVALAGGFSATANRNYVVVTRDVGGSERRIPVPVGEISKGLAANLELQSGDIVYVPDTLL